LTWRKGGIKTKNAYLKTGRGERAIVKGKREGRRGGRKEGSLARKKAKKG